MARERYASRIANAIVHKRADKPIETTLELADIIACAMPAAARSGSAAPRKTDVSGDTHRGKRRA